MVSGEMQELSLMEDPFLALSPFKNHESLYLRHGHEVLFSFLLYQFIVYRIVAPVVNRMIFGKHYAEAVQNVKVNYDIHTVSTVQALVCVGLVIPIVSLNANLQIFGYYNEYASMTAAISLGYFLWDLYICLKFFSFFGLGFLGHAIGSLAVIFCSLMPSYQSWIGKFLVFEASTPFVNINWYITQVSRKTTKAIVPAWFNIINGLLLLGTFFFTRICWGIIALVSLDYQVWKQWNSDTPMLVGLLVPTINLLMTILNIYWFYKMIRIAKKMVNASKKVTKVT
ncbi:Tda4p Ecym_7191 [Eremothecium cymbalariae DBVPG|uniref:TLC domain-containing protein n=1 Tax=Eremothecium cymbalariae (strain CBS 270.75 / DBVPG 7215 / KCTC 17166 / NRRL Y-17582) TaxID=931890 RepID=G8JW24_ERECY|nr:hypothetical protein Ecym_7191 [Eremothecium cymbalariae DBVPG\